MNSKWLGEMIRRLIDKLKGPIPAAAALLFVLCAPVEAVVRRNFVIFTGASTDTTAVGMADSSAVLFTSGLSQMTLYLKPNRPCRIAIRVSSHGDSLAPSGAVSLSDTTKSFVWDWRVASQGTIDTLSIREVSYPTSVLPGAEELTVEFRAEGVSKWGSPRGRVIPLCNQVGAWYSGANTRIRLRVLSASGVVTWNAVLGGVTN